MWRTPAPAGESREDLRLAQQHEPDKEHKLLKNKVKQLEEMIKERDKRQAEQAEREAEEAEEAEQESNKAKKRRRQRADSEPDEPWPTEPDSPQIYILLTMLAVKRAVTTAGHSRSKNGLGTFNKKERPRRLSVEELKRINKALPESTILLKQHHAHVSPSTSLSHAITHT